MSDNSLYFESGTNLPETAQQIFEASRTIISAFERINSTKLTAGQGDPVAGLRKMVSEYEQVGAQLGREIEKIRAQASQQIAHPSVAGAPQGDAIAKLNQAGKAAADKMLAQLAQQIEQAPSALKGTNVMAQVMNQVANEFDEFVRTQAGQARRAIQEAARRQGVAPAEVLGGGRLNYPKVNAAFAAQFPAGSTSVSAESRQATESASVVAREMSRQASLQRLITSANQRQLDAASKSAQAAAAASAPAPRALGYFAPGGAAGVSSAPAPLGTSEELRENQRLAALRAQRPAASQFQIPSPPVIQPGPSSGAVRYLDYQRQQGRAARDHDYANDPNLALFSLPPSYGNPKYSAFRPSQSDAGDRRFDPDYHIAANAYIDKRLVSEQNRVAIQSDAGTSTRYNYDTQRARIYRQLDQGVLGVPDYHQLLGDLGDRPVRPAYIPHLPSQSGAQLPPVARREYQTKFEEDRQLQLAAEQLRTGVPDTSAQGRYEQARAQILQDVKDKQFGPTGYRDALDDLGDRPGNGAQYFPRQDRQGRVLGERVAPQAYGLGEHIPGGRPIATGPKTNANTEQAYYDAMIKLGRGGFQEDNGVYRNLPFDDTAARDYSNKLLRFPAELGRREPQELKLDFDQMVGFQGWVGKQHVEELAKIPQDQFQGQDTPNVYKLPDDQRTADGRQKYLLRDGYHRTAAAGLRGDDGIRVRIAGEYGNYPTSDEIGNLRSQAEQENRDRGFTLNQGPGPRALGYFAPGGAAGVSAAAVPPANARALGYFAPGGVGNPSSGALPSLGGSITDAEREMSAILRELKELVNGTSQSLSASKSLSVPKNVNLADPADGPQFGGYENEAERRRMAGFERSVRRNTPDDISDSSGPPVDLTPISLDRGAEVMREHERRMDERDRREDQAYEAENARREAEFANDPISFPPISLPDLSESDLSKIRTPNTPRNIMRGLSEVPAYGDDDNDDISRPAISNRTGIDPQAEGHKTGEAISAGLAQGMSAGTSEVISAANQVAQEIIDKLSGDLGIASPSKKTDAMGQEIINGFIVGMNKRLDQLRAEAEKVADVLDEGLNKPERYRDPDTGRFAKRPEGPYRDPKTGRFAPRPGAGGGGAGSGDEPPLLPPPPSEPEPERARFEANLRGQVLAAQRAAIEGGGTHTTLYGGGERPTGYELPDFLRTLPGPRAPGYPVAPLGDPYQEQLFRQQGTRIAGAFTGRPGGARFEPVYQTPDFLLGPKPGPNDPGFPVAPQFSPGRLAEPSTYVDRINKTGGAYEQAQAEAVARQQAAEQNERDATERRRQIGLAQVASGAATKAGNFTFGPDGSVINSAGKLVTEYKELKQATDALVASVEKQIQAQHQAAEETGKTPLNQFYKGFLGAGGRKYRGGAQEVDTENPLNGLFETAGVVAKYEVLGRGMQALAGQAVGAIKQFAALDQSTRELNEQLGDGNHVSNSYVSSLEDIATAAGGDLTDAMDAARRGIAAFSDTADSAATKQAAGTDTATAASQNSVVTGQGIGDSTSDLIAIGQSYELTASQLGDVTNAVANARESFGSDSNEVQKGLAELGDVGKEAGFSLSQLAQVIGLIQAKTGESGSAIASTLTRIFSTLSNGSTSSDLSKSLGIDLTGTVQQKIEQLAKAYPALTTAEKQQLEATVGGAKGLRDLVPLLQGQASYQKAAAKAVSDSTAGQREYQAIIGSVQGQLKVFGATIKQLALDIARTGILAPLVVGFELLKPAVTIIDDIVKTFDKLPDPIKNSVALLLEAVVAFNAIKAASAAGVATLGVGRLLGGGRQLTGHLLGNPFRGAADPASRARQLGSAEAEGPLLLGVPRATENSEAALAGVRKAEQDGAIAIGRAATHTSEVVAAGGDEIAVAEAKAAEAVAIASRDTAVLAAQGKLAESSRALDLETEAATKSRAESASAEKLTNAEAVTSLKAFVVAVREADVAISQMAVNGEEGLIAKAGQGIRGKVGSAAVRDAETGVVEAEGTGLYRPGGALARGSKLSTLGVGDEALGLGEVGLGTTLLGAGGTIAAFTLLTIALHHNLDAQQKAADAQDKAGTEAENSVGKGADAARKAADALTAAGKQVDSSRNSFSGRFNRLTSNDNATGLHDAAQDRTTAGVLNTEASKLDAAAANSSSVAGAFNLSAPTGVQVGLDTLATKGYTAAQALAALWKSIDQVTGSAKGLTGGLSAYESSTLPEGLAIGDASQRRDSLEYITSGAYKKNDNTDAAKNTPANIAAGQTYDTESYDDILASQAKDVQSTLDKTDKGSGKTNAQLIADDQQRLDTIAQQKVGGFGPGQKPNAAQLAEFQKLREADYVKAFKDITGKDLEQLKKDYPELYKALVTDPIHNSDVTNIATAQSVAVKKITATQTIAGITAQVPGQAATDAQNAATNISLGLNPDGSNPAAGPPKRPQPKPLDPLDATSGEITQNKRTTDAADEARYRFQLNKYEHDKNRQAQYQTEGAAVTSDRVTVADLEKAIAEQKKLGANPTQLQPLEQKLREAQVKLQSDVVTNLQSLSAVAVASLGEFDKSGVIEAQLGFLDQEIKATKDPTTKRGLVAQRLQLVQQQADQALTDRANVILASIPTSDTTATADATLAAAQAKLTQIQHDPHASAGDTAAQQIVVNQQALQAAQAHQADATTAANNQLAIGDSLGEQRNAAAALFRQANDSTIDSTPLQRQRDRRAGASAYADYRIASNQAYGALTLSKIDPRDALAVDAATKATDERALKRVKPGDITGKATAQAALRDLALKTTQDQLDYANSIRLASSDPQNAVQQSTIILKDAQARLKAANPKEADYGKLKQDVLNAQQGQASAIDAAALATSLARTDPRDKVAVDRANLSGPGGLDAQIKDFKGSHKDAAFQALLLQRRQAQLQLIQDQNAQADALAESGIDSRDLTGEAAEKLREAKEHLDADLPGTEQYGLDLKIYKDAQLASANTAAETANAALEASVAPGDAIGAARVQIQEAQAALARALPGQAAYFQAQKDLVAGEYALSAAQEGYANTLDLLGRDTTNPVEVAQAAVDAARRKYADDAALQAKTGLSDPAALAADQLNVTQSQNAEQKTLFEQQLQDAGTNFSLHRISGAAYIQYLRAQQANLKATGLGTRQLVDEYNEVSQQLLSANQQLTGQFNIGNIKVPTVYQERRLAGQNGIDINPTLDTTGSTAFGADTSPLAQAANSRLSPLVRAVNSISTQYAVDQLSQLQTVLNALGGGATPASSGNPAGGALSNVSNSSVAHVTINGADLAQVKSLLGSLLGSTAISSNGTTATIKKVG